MHSDCYCRVCGYGLSSPPWGEDGSTPTWEICPCCGTEFGYEDCTPASARRKRNQWILNGKKWFENKEKPADWDWDRQFQNIPDSYK